MAFFDEYKPFRNYMRRFDRTQSLVDVWCYFQHITENRPLPPDYAVGRPFSVPIKGRVWPWELDTLAREIVLNAGKGGDRSLRNWKAFADAVDHIKRLDEEAYRADPEVDVLWELHRIVHRQIPRQIRPTVNSMMRAVKIFGRSTVDPIVVRELGMTMRQFFLLGMGVAGHFKNKLVLSATHEYTDPLGISRDTSKAFFDRITCAIDGLRANTVKQQSYGPDWAYTWNPLEATPLVRPEPSVPDRVICPIPDYLLRRTSTGVYYDLVKSPDFDNPFGKSFQDYIGEVLDAVCKPPRFTILPEEPYYVGSKRFDGVDWVLSDNTGHLFIEAKTKRLTLYSRIRNDDVALENDLGTMADAIVQHYQNIRRALDQKTKWVPDDLPVYPIILTLEDWYILSPRVSEKLNTHLRRLMAERGVPQEMLTDMPFTVASTHDFETASQVIAQVGIDAVMAMKTAVERWNWSLSPFLNQNFGEQMKTVNWQIFGQEFRELVPERARP